MNSQEDKNKKEEEIEEVLDKKDLISFSENVDLKIDKSLKNGTDINFKMFGYETDGRE